MYSLSIFAAITGVVVVDAWSFTLPGGQRVSYDNGIFRMQLETLATPVKMPRATAKISPKTLSCLQVRDTGTCKGYGAFCISDEIPPCEFLGFYEGTVVTYGHNDANDYPKGDYLMSLDGGVTFLDGYDRARDRSVFSPAHLNHADKGPASKANCIRIFEEGRVAFFTARTIKVGKELCFDYGSNYWRGREKQKI
jgi:hypothetical protein